ncbi:MAG: Hpt domain-containing protein, partial [Planctomycetota bacterium]
PLPGVSAEIAPPPEVTDSEIEETGEKVSNEYFDEVGLLDRCLNRRDFAEEIVQEFLDTVDAYRAGIAKSFETDDAALIEAEVHQLKGVAGNLSATMVFETSNQMLAMVRKGEIEPARQLISELTSQMDATIPVLREFVTPVTV